ncbi:GNAT family N-acetyltransferase [Aeromicrobium sp. Leaf350]|uniref:GNAT family N-acetyltransferase n=1 Tax=Aeromicrobium sp. Leaf350 TaxID=2876565 RepID=UPI001E47E65A|nr:GNAT family N-acetyltransferase [Aeromicrobium sp. Leaf350]
MSTTEESRDELRGWYPDVTTERFTLRPYRHEDAADVLAIHSLLEVVRWLDNPPFHLMPDEAAAVARVDEYLRIEADDPLCAFRAIVAHDTGRVVGTVLVSHCDRIDGGFVGEYQLGWHLHPDAHGHGYASTAARILAHQAFTAGLDELVIGMYPENVASAAVARRLGAFDRGVLPDPWYGGDSQLFALRSEHLAHVETERLVLRRFTRHDLDVLAELFALPEVARWSGPRRPRTREEVRIGLANQPGRAGTHPAAAIFAVCVKGDDRPIGQVMLGPLPASSGVDRHDHEIGWHFFPRAQGHGYATEAARALVERAAAGGITEVYAVTDPANAPSQAVCGRLGMTDLGPRDDWYDTTVRAFRLATEAAPR